MRVKIPPECRWISFNNANMMKPANPWEGSAEQLVHNLEKAFDRRPPDPDELLPAAVSLFLRVIEENHPEEECSVVTLRFDGSALHRETEFVSVENGDGRLLDLTRWFSKWRADAFLCRACAVYLDRHLPEWGSEDGACGYLVIGVERESRERWVLTPRGKAMVRTPRVMARDFPLPGVPAGD